MNFQSRFRRSPISTSDDGVEMAMPSTISCSSIRWKFVSKAQLTTVLLKTIEKRSIDELCREENLTNLRRQKKLLRKIVERVNRFSPLIEFIRLWFSSSSVLFDENVLSLLNFIPKPKRTIFRTILRSKFLERKSLRLFSFSLFFYIRMALGSLFSLFHFTLFFASLSVL